MYYGSVVLKYTNGLTDTLPLIICTSLCSLYTSLPFYHLAQSVKVIIRNLVRMCTVYSTHYLRKDLSEFREVEVMGKFLWKIFSCS